VSLTYVFTREIKGTGRIDLRITSEKVLTLQNILHVPMLRKNLISESSLLRASYRIVKESNKFVISKWNIFFKKCFVCNSLFRLNVIILLIIKFLFLLLWTLGVVISGMINWDMLTSIQSRKWLTRISFLNFSLTNLLDMKYVFKTNISEHLFILSY